MHVFKSFYVALYLHIFVFNVKHKQSALGNILTNIPNICAFDIIYTLHLKKNARGGRGREKETVRAWETQRVMSANIVQSEFISIVIAYYCNYLVTLKKYREFIFFDAFAIHFAVYVEKIVLLVSLHWLELYIIGCAHFILRDWIHNCLFNFQYMDQLIFVVKA